MQLKEKPELNQINQESEVLEKNYQPYRPIKERKSVATTDRPDLQPIKELKSVATTDRQNLQTIKERKSLATTEWPDLPPLKERKSVTTVDIQPKEKLELNQINQKLAVSVKTYRPNLQPIKERKSVTTVDRQDLRSIKNRKSVATTYQPYLRSIKERESVATMLLKIIFIYFPLAILRILLGIILLVIVAAIAIPDLASCGNKARQSEGKQYVGSMNRAQQAKYADNGAFSNSITALGLGIKSETTNYNYSIGATKNAAFSYGVARSNNLLSHVGAVFLVPSSAGVKNEMTTVSILCQVNSPGKTQPPNPILQNNVPVCAAGSSVVSK